MDKPHKDTPPKMPTENYSYHSKLVKDWRSDLKPLNVDQPEGPSFKVNHNYVRGLGHVCSQTKGKDGLHIIFF